jgi:hypothetical protein
MYTRVYPKNAKNVILVYDTGTVLKIQSMFEDRGPRVQDHREPSLCDVTSAANRTTKDASFEPGVASFVELALCRDRPRRRRNAEAAKLYGFEALWLFDAGPVATTLRQYEYTAQQSIERTKSS